MKSKRFFFASYLSLGALCLFISIPLQAEIILLDGDKAVSVDSSYAYVHPRMRSFVFSSPQYRDMAILPPAPYFMGVPPLLMRAPGPLIAYPPVVYQSGINNPVRPSNRDITTYNLARAHAFSQGYYSPGAYANYAVSPFLYASPYSVMPYYAPANQSGGFNQPARPSNRDNTTYNLERAHRFSMDAYRRP
ncbi:MAG: hypothetical protein WCK63_14760 [Betaproteobacteria bacterium]